MEYRILGPVEVVAEGSRVELGGPLERALLARLVLADGRVVAVDRLIGDLWPGEPPGSAVNAVRVRISRLRKKLAHGAGDEVIRFQSPGYALLLGAEDTVDAVVFEDLSERGRAALLAGDAESAARLSREALALWRGPALADVGDAPFALAEAGRVEEQALHTLEDRIDADLALGRHAGLVGELEALCAQHPLRERFWAQRMLALYRSGRQAEALTAFQDLRRALAEDLGLDPSSELVGLEAEILARAADLELPQQGAGPATTPSLPTGVITFLLTDIERSTELWERHGAAMADALQRHDRIVDAVVAERRGSVIKSKGEGDATLSVFPRASDAVAAALDLQRALEVEAWPHAMAMRVRIGIHAGEAHERDGDYFGPAVNRAARVRSLARGGQILVSHIAAELVQDQLPASATLVDVGERSLRGMARAEHIFELRPQGPGTTDGDTASAGPRRTALPDAVVAAGAAPFVGRETELKQLRDAYDATSDGGLRLVFAAGEPGIGKTRLCAEFARTAYEAGAVVLYGRCDEASLVPYQPFIEALRRWVIQLSPAERAAVPRAEQLAPLISEIVATASSGTVDDPEVARYKLFEAIASAIEHAAIAGPMLLVLDDLHWADSPTLQLLQHLLRTRAASRILVLGTYRETDLARTRPLAAALADLRRDRAYQRLALTGLDEGEILTLLQRAAQHDVGRAGQSLAHALRQTTEGNPFFIEQIVANLVDSGRLVLRDGRWELDARVEDLGIPEGVLEAIGRRLSRLSDSCNTTLAAASVLGRDFDVEILTRVTGRDPDEVLAAIEEGLEVGLVRESPARDRPACTFSHALVQKALYEELSLARKQRLHLKAAAALEETYAKQIDPHVTAVARHLRAAGAAADEHKAIDYSVRAMEAAAGVFAFEEAIAHGEAAVELMEEQRGRDADLARLHERLGDMHYVAGVEYERSFAHYDTALAALEERGDVAKVARVHIKLGRGLSTYIDEHADATKALEHLHAAEEIVDVTSDHPLAGPLAIGLTAAHIWSLDVERGLADARRAMEIGGRGSSLWSTGAAIEGWALAMLGRHDDGAAMLEEAWIVADELDHVLAGFAAAWTRGYGYQLRRPRDHYRLALLELGKPRQAQTVNTRRMLRAVAAGALACGGEIEDARALLAGDPRAPVGPGVKYTFDSFEAMESHAVAWVEQFRAQGHHYLQVTSMTYNLAPVQAALGGTERSRHTLQAAIDLVGGRALTEECEARSRLVMLDASDHRIEEATANLARCDEIIAQGNGWQGYLALVVMAKASVAAATGNVGEADALFAHAASSFRQHELPFEEADALHRWGQALAARDPHGAAEKYDAALEIYTSRGVGKAWTEHVLADRSAHEPPR